MYQIVIKVSVVHLCEDGVLCTVFICHDRGSLSLLNCAWNIPSLIFSCLNINCIIFRLTECLGLMRSSISYIKCKFWKLVSMLTQIPSHHISSLYAILLKVRAIIFTHIPTSLLQMPAQENTWLGPVARWGQKKMTALVLHPRAASLTNWQMLLM